MGKIEKPGDDVKKAIYTMAGHVHITLPIFSSSPHLCDVYINSPGTTHNSSMPSYRKIYEKVDAIYKCFIGNVKIMVDSAFFRGGTRFVDEIYSKF